MQTTMQMDEAGMMQPFNNLQVNGGIVTYMAELPDVSNAEDQADKEYVPCAVAANSVTSKNLTGSSFIGGNWQGYLDTQLYGSRILYQSNYGGAISHSGGGGINFYSASFIRNYASNCSSIAGGALKSEDGTLIFSNTEFTSNTLYATDSKYYYTSSVSATALARGGAIALWQGAMELNSVTFSGNRAEASTFAYASNYYGAYAEANSYALGGALYLVDCDNVILKATKFYDNCAGAFTRASAGAAYNVSFSVFGDGGGGALYVHGGKQKLTDIEFVNNVATRDGGAIYIGNAGTEMSITNAVFSYNGVGGSQESYRDSAYKSARGGAVNVNHGNLNLTSVVFSKNIATVSAYASNYAAYAYASGGAIATYSANVNIGTVKFYSNSAYAEAKGATSVCCAYGGALYAWDGTTQMTNTEFQNNVAGSGGAIYLRGSATATYTVTKGNTVKNIGNDATLGGFLYLDFNSAMTFTVQNGGTLIIGEANSEYDSIAGTGSITKNGTGVMTVYSDIFMHTGRWNLAAGTLQLLAQAPLMSLDNWTIDTAAKLEFGELDDNVSVDSAKTFGTIDLGNGTNLFMTSAATSITALSAGIGDDGAFLDGVTTIGTLDLGSGANNVAVEKSLTINNFVRLNNGGCTTISINQNAQLGGNSIAVSASGNLSGLTTYNLNWANVANSDSVRILVSNGIKSNVYQFSLELHNGTKNLTLKTDASNTVYFQVKNGSSWQTVTIPGLQPTVSRKPAGDIDGNGVSDVMFQYKVDHQIGFWMNGSNTWKGQGLPEPAEWEVVGAYDMNANGKADVVMLGNVTVNGLKGAYVGYRKDGDTSTWETISYLKNPDNVQWNAKVGNMTGNAGKNSIVWHAAELSAVGVWTDGTDNWVAISGGFDKNWTMLGTGDFNGNGKDEILFLYNGSLYTTDIDGNFVSLGNAAGWNVCAIGDFSADGKDDLILFHKETGSVMKYENGQSSHWSSLGQLDAGDWFIVGAGDYNGDGKDDLLVRQYSTGMLGYYAGANLSKWTEMGRGVDMNWAVIA